MVEKQKLICRLCHRTFGHIFATEKITKYFCKSCYELIDLGAKNIQESIDNDILESYIKDGGVMEKITCCFCGSTDCKKYNGLRAICKKCSKKRSDKERSKSWKDMDHLSEFTQCCKFCGSGLEGYSNEEIEQDDKIRCYDCPEIGLWINGDVFWVEYPVVGDV